MLIRKIDPLTDTALIASFLEKAGNSLNSFRYFNKRPLEIIKNHVITLAGIKNEDMICYGHLDKEKNDIWLGIAIVENELGNGYGKQMMAALIHAATACSIKKIQLSVDKTNIAAIRLYERSGFVRMSEKTDYFLYNLILP